MRFTASILAATVAYGSAFASAVPLEARQEELKPFEVNAVGFSSPSGRSGSSPWSVIRAEVTDPNSYAFTAGTVSSTIPAGSKGTNCLAQWYIGEDLTLGRTWPCDAVSQGHWAMQVIAGTSGKFAPTDFKLKFIHAAEPGQINPTFRARVEGEGLFKTGVNGTTSYACAGSGSCGAYLKDALTPLLVPVTRTT